MAAIDAAASHADLIAALVEHIDQGIVVFDSQHLVRWANDRYAALLDLPPDLARPGAPGLGIAQFLARRGDFGPGDPDELARRITERVRSVELRLEERRYANGRWLQANRRLLPSGGVVVVLTDISAVKQAEAQRLQAHAALAGTLANIEQGVAVYDRDQVLTFCNARYGAMLSLPDGMLQPHRTTLRDLTRAMAARGLYGAGDPDRLADERLALLRTGELASAERRMPDGRWLLVLRNRLDDGGFVVTVTDITQLKSAEAELAGARDVAEAWRRRLQEALDTIHEGFVLWDADDRLVMFNRRYRDEYTFAPELLRPGLRFDELIRESMRRGMVPASYTADEWVAERLRQHRDPGAPYVVQRHDGRWTLISEYRTAEGGIVGLRNDVTPLKQAEAEARASQRRLLEAIEAIPQGFALFDRDDRLAVFNARYRDRFSLVPEIVAIGRSFEELAREAIRRGAVNAPANAPEAWLAERVAQHRAGQRNMVSRRHGRWVQLNESRTASGDVVVMFTDVTDLKQRQRELRESRRLLRGVIDAVPAVINVKDPAGRYVLMNRFQGEVFGLDPAAAVGHTAYEVSQSEYSRRSLEMDLEVVRSGAALPWMERPYVDARGRARTWFTAKLPLKNDSGQVGHIVSVALDITQLKSVERARANLSRYFAPGVAEMLARSDEPFGPARSAEIGVLFVDMIGFTRLAERLDAAQAFELLREFHARMASGVFMHGGTLDKFTGDGLMATFGTPQSGASDAAAAVNCARALAELAALWRHERNARGQAAPRVGVGVHWGPALMGNIGDEHRMEFAVVGDTVNVASRLERLNRGFSSDVVASAALVEMARQQGAEVEGFINRGMQAVPGRSGAIEVCTLSLGQAE
jgi:PAS domain S-box-containing protein